jgi:MFS family permease
MTRTSRFKKVAAAGITFQAGSAAVDSGTIMSALIFQLTGSPVAVGAVTAILRFGWLFPQLIVGFLAQRSGSSMGYYNIGAFGRATCMALLAGVLYEGAEWSRPLLATAVMILWTAYAFISGIVAVPYNDIVARSVPSEQRSRLLAIRFFGGGLLALVVVALADRFVSKLNFPHSYVAIIAMAAFLMFISSGIFSSMGEPQATSTKKSANNFFRYLKDGIGVLQTDKRFSRFVYAQWCSGAVLMATPFYVIQANVSGIAFERIALLLGAQTVGALASNFLWGWWGDKRGKVSLLKAIALGRVFPPVIMLTLIISNIIQPETGFPVFLVVFFVLGALANGLTIAVIGFLMEISPNDQRPAYSGYFNAITAPAFLLPLLAGIITAAFGLQVVFAISAAAAISQFILLTQIPTNA